MATTDPNDNKGNGRAFKEAQAGRRAENLSRAISPRRKGGKRMKRTLIALALIIFIASVSFASVPVARTDNFLEKLFLARYEEMQSWLQNVAYTISNPKTLGDLLALPNKLSG